MVGLDYDPLLAKLVVSAPDHEVSWLAVDGAVRRLEAVEALPTKLGPGLGRRGGSFAVAWVFYKMRRRREATEAVLVYPHRRTVGDSPSREARSSPSEGRLSRESASVDWVGLIKRNLANCKGSATIAKF